MKSIYKIIDTIGTLILLNLLFMFTTVITLGIGFGSSLSALYASLLELQTDDSGYYVRNYFKNFKRNVGVSTKVWIILFFLMIACYFNYLMINTIESQGIKLILLALLGAFIIELTFVSTYVFAIIAKFEVTPMKSIILSLYYAHRYIHKTLLFVILWVLSVMIPTFISFAFIFILFALVTKIQSSFLRNIWRSMYANEKISEI